eukprot:350955-Chlamydomonas_euryale.AAC.4
MSVSRRVRPPQSRHSACMRRAAWMLASARLLAGPLHARPTSAAPASLPGDGLGVRCVRQTARWRVAAFGPRCAESTQLRRDRIHALRLPRAMDEPAKRRRVDAVSGSPVQALIDSEVLVSHSAGQSFRVPGGLHCTDHNFKTALDYSGEVRSDAERGMQRVRSDPGLARSREDV